ncbi:MAG: peptidylprolyl isomerase [Candidatus Puniceispirillales bacterium]|jgi:peptidylprolyl isomerase|nr:peptidylprolyl isomerase [Pseudomonadota bacterium]|tara:strand:- start:305 stop:835 length:531 start_codon:yes stop_codon:yes gene_type:complete
MFKNLILITIGMVFITMAQPIKKASASKSKFITIETSKGKVIIETLPKIAPNHVKRIKQLVQSEFYDGLIFHRVIEGFMAQTGDPDGNGTGGSGKNLKAEFSDYEYKYGTVGMARSMSPDSGDSQFFICFNGCSHLTGQYTVWGQVVSGMETIEKLAIGEPPSSPDKMISVKIGKK